MSRQRQQIKRALRERDAQDRAAAFSRRIRLTTAAQLIDGQIAQPVAEAWLHRRQADRAPAGKTCPEAGDAPCSLTDADPGCCARDHQP